MAAKYAGWAWGMLLGTLDADDVAELWDEFPEDLREINNDGVITLWARSADGKFRFAPIYLRPADNAA